MTYVITQRCCNDASCLAVCPVDCIRPTPRAEEFAAAEMLYIDPGSCIDCGACVDACPPGAIYHEDELPPELERFRQVNADFFASFPLEDEAPPVDRTVRVTEKLRVAIVGSGPAGCYAAEDLLARGDVEVEMIERLPTPYGLVRSGVAPDHWETKRVVRSFESAFKVDRFRYHLNVEVGRHLGIEEMRAHHHAVVFAVGAPADGRLDIPGEDLPGSRSASDFVAWYNGHPEHADDTWDLTSHRAVVVGNGNVALDVARILTMDHVRLKTTDIATHAWAALADSLVEEVVVLGRRGPRQAAFTAAELMALGNLPGVDVVVDPEDLEEGDAPSATGDRSSFSSDLKVHLLREYAARPATPGNKRIVLRFLTSPSSVLGSDRAVALEVEHNHLVDVDGRPVARGTGRTETIDAGLVLRSVGYRAHPVPGLPFDEGRGLVPNDEGRVTGNAGPLPGLYVTGWVKRGPRGVIGTNRACARQTVEHLVEDFEAGVLQVPAGGRDEFERLVRVRQPDVVDAAGWRAIDLAEVSAGAASGRPRVKLTSVDDMVEVARRAE